MFKYVLSEAVKNNLQYYKKNSEELKYFFDALSNGFTKGCSCKGLWIKKLHGKTKKIFETRLNDGDRLLFTIQNVHDSESGKNDALIVLLDISEHDKVNITADKYNDLSSIRFIHYDANKICDLYKDNISSDQFINELHEEISYVSDTDELKYFDRYYEFISAEELCGWISEQQQDLFLKLTGEQWKITDPSKTGPVFLYGGPGSGKTSIMLFRMYRIGEPDETLFITYNIKLLELAKELFKSIPGTDKFLNKMTFVSANEACKLKRKFKYIFIDESQDLNKNNFDDIVKLVSDKSGLFFSADIRQNIYNTNFNISKIYSQLKNISIEHLKINYRNTKTIYEFALSLFDKYEEFKPGEYKDMYSKASDYIGEPIGYSATVKKQIQQELQDILKDEYVPILSLAIIVRDEKIKQELSVDYDIIKSIVFTLEEVKGLEFDNVILWDVFSLLEKNLNKENVHKIYVAITRARKNLYIVKAENFKNKNFKNDSLKIWYENIRNISDNEEFLKNKLTEYFTKKIGKQINELIQNNEYAKAAKIYERVKDYDKAAKLYEQSGNNNKAAEMYEQAKNYDKAAKLYEQAKSYIKAAKLYEQIGNNSKTTEMLAIIKIQKQMNDFITELAHFEGLLKTNVSNKYLQDFKSKWLDYAGKIQDRNLVRRFNTLLGLNIALPKAKTGDIEIIDLGGGVKFEMVYIEGDSFYMGSNDGENDEKPVHRVIVDGYYIGKYEVTQAQWKAVMGNNTSYFQGDNLPVEQVSWKDCQDFIKKINSRTGMSFRLPTEAEWEYAARGGQDYKYSGSDNIDEVAWYGNNSESQPHSVGGKKPNAFGLYDMSGNLLEWCQDWYGDKYYSSRPTKNPPGPSSGSMRVLRGGGWDFIDDACRVTTRYYYNSSGSFDAGFRLLRTD